MSTRGGMNHLMSCALNRDGAEADDSQCTCGAFQGAAKRTDTERLDWLQRARATVYKSEGAPHWVVVDETRPSRMGRIGSTLREAIDTAMSSHK